MCSMISVLKKKENSQIRPEENVPLVSKIMGDFSPSSSLYFQMFGIYYFEALF